MLQKTLALRLGLPYILGEDDMDAFFEFIHKRRAKLKKELEELDTAERVYRESGIQIPPIAQHRLFPASWPVRTPTMKEGVVLLLKEREPLGLTALEILDRIQSRWNKNLQRTSLSPQLTRLKNDGVIRNDKGAWKLITETLEKTEAPANSGASEEGGQPPSSSSQDA